MKRAVWLALWCLVVVSAPLAMDWGRGDRGAGVLSAAAVQDDEQPGEKPEWLVKPKVLLLIYNPVIESREGKRLNEVMGWGDPDKLTQTYIQDVKEVSHGLVEYQIAERIEADEFPVKEDGFSYTDQTFLECYKNGGGFHHPDGVNYKAIIQKYDLCRKVEDGEIDEVFLWGAPYFGYYESRMVGSGAYWCNSPPLDDVECSKLFVIMGFNYERGVGEMLEDLGHRTESIMWHIFGDWESGKERNDWERFTLYDKVAPGRSACGNVHWAPNSQGDYDWGNKTYVWSTCDDWLDYPSLTGEKRLVNCDEWGGGDIRGHHKWWLTHLPHALGQTNSHQNNWWKYVIDLNTFKKESE